MTALNFPNSPAYNDTYSKYRWDGEKWMPVHTVLASSEVAAFLVRTSGLDTTHTNAYTALIDGLVADGVWAKLDLLHIYATQDTATAQLNLKSTSYPATLNGSPTFTADRGYTGVNASTTVYINSGFNPTTAPSPKFTQNSAHLSCWVLTNANNANSAIGQSTSGGSNNYILPQYTGGDAYFRINDYLNSGVNVAVAASTGHFLGNVSTSSNTQGYRNGASIATSTSDFRVAPINSNIYMLGSNNNGTPNGCNYQQAMASVGSSLTSGEATAFYNRLRTYMTAVGVP